MNLIIEKLKEKNVFIIFLGMIIPFLYFINLEWNPSSSSKGMMDMFFDADCWRVFENLKDSGVVSHSRDKVHPYFSIFAVTTAKLGLFLGIDNFEFYKVFFGTCGVFLFWFFLFKETSLLLSFSAMTLLLSTLTVRVWSTLPETFIFGFFTLMLGLNLIRKNTKIEYVWLVTISGTITNVAFGFLYAIGKIKTKKDLYSLISRFLVLALLISIIQRNSYPTSVYFFDFFALKEEASYINTSLKAIPFRVFDFFISGFVMPLTDKLSLPISSKDIWKDFFHDFIFIPKRVVVFTILSIFIISAILCSALFSFFKREIPNKIGVLIALFILFQLLLHLVYGDAPFLYSYHYTPFLILFITLYQPEKIKAAIPLIFIMLSIAIQDVNLRNFNTLFNNKFMEASRTQSGQMISQMRIRHEDPWPRGKEHIVLAAPGSLEVDKAYHEAGGSFSPSVSSFGASIWLVDEHGNLNLTSDSIPLSDIEQQFNWGLKQDIPEVHTKTKQYRAYWSSSAPRVWTFNLKSVSNDNTKPMVVIRSVGPAGGPITSIDRNGERLLINNRWEIIIEPNSAQVSLGTETTDWVTRRSYINHINDNEGWCYAMIEPKDGSHFSLVIKDTATPKPSAELKVSSARSAVALNLPDKRFAASLDAQVAHLMMSLVGKETRPGEPTSYPLAWQRDGAYQVVALARSGQLQVARELATYFAENDFFGGFGSEADAPGLSIWALEEVAVRLNQLKFDEWLWPHIYRKAEFIMKMLTADQPIRQKYTGSVLPKYKHNSELDLIADPAKNGLIVGRMDWHRPLVFVNAVSYRGLLDAASLADRVNHPEDAKRWRTSAAQLKQAWEVLNKSAEESDNDRSYIASLWPTSIATSQKELLLNNLQQRWLKKRDADGDFLKFPLWTYFDIAETHQWLLLDKPENVFKTLQWFWQHQSSPGLYTWWEGKEELSTFWKPIRGWVKPNPVTPHYWTAAEMLLLQLDMLAYVDESAPEPTLVIGGGIPQEWLSQPMSVTGLSLPSGQVDWRWDGKNMNVYLRGAKYKIRLGATFPLNTPVILSH